MFVLEWYGSDSGELGDWAVEVPLAGFDGGAWGGCISLCAGSVSGLFVEEMGVEFAFDKGI
jgi:hypothetical protein